MNSSETLRALRSCVLTGSALLACGGSPANTVPPAPRTEQQPAMPAPGAAVTPESPSAMPSGGPAPGEMVTPSGLSGGMPMPMGNPSEMPAPEPMALPCTVSQLSAAVSQVIPTVGIVEFSTSLAAVEGARIDFGLDTSYGMSAPVDLAEPNYRTLLLGMKAGRQYHYRIVAQGAGAECASADATLTTGPLANDLPEIETTESVPGAQAGGFLMTGRYARQAGTAPAYVLDADGDFVWWYRINADVTNARMSYDGKSMWISAANVPETQGARVHRVSMDGLVDEDLSDEFTGQNHQFAVLPDETVAFFAYGQNGCDDIKERSPDGRVRTVINARTAHGADGDCHVNFLEYSPEDDTFVFSDLDHDNITKVTRTGDVVWVLSGPTNDYTGMGSSWMRQHGIDVLGVNRLLIFNNGGLGGGNNSSLALELQLNVTARTTSIAWQYAAMPGIQNQVMGDVQRLPNGNTVVAYSTQGVLHEVNPQGNLVRELTWGLGGAFGYVVQRPSLYGPPPR